LEEEFVFKPMIVQEQSANMPMKGKNAGNMTPAQSDPTDTILTSKTFGFEINGAELSVTEVLPGELTFELSDATMGKRKGNRKNIVQVNYGEWEVKKNIIKGDVALKTLFDNFTKGAIGGHGSASRISASIFYHDRTGTTQRAIHAHNIIPVSYDSVSVDSRQGTVATESLRFRVEYCTFE